MKTKINKIEKAINIVSVCALVLFLSGVFSMLFAIPLHRFGAPSWVSTALIYWFGISFMIAVGLFVLCDELMGRASKLREIERRELWNQKHPNFIIK